MCMLRLYRAAKELRDIEAVVKAATFTGNYTPPKALPRGGELEQRLRKVTTEHNAALEEAILIVEGDPQARKSRVRAAGERDIIQFILNSFIAQGFEIQLQDEEGETTFWVKDAGEILPDVVDIEISHINVRNPSKRCVGWMMFVLGNSPAEVLADHTTNLEEFLKPSFEYIQAFYDPDYVV